jgi:hypothetical protein
MGQLYYHSTTRKCTKCRSGANFSLAEPTAILEISEKPSLLTGVLIANTTGTQPLFAIGPHDVYIVWMIMQSFSINATYAARATVANTYDARIAMKIMRRMIKNVANGNKCYLGSIGGRFDPISRIHPTLPNGRHQQHVYMRATKRGKGIQSYDYSVTKCIGNRRACPIGLGTILRQWRDTNQDTGLYPYLS